MMKLARVLPVFALLGGCVIHESSDNDCCAQPPPPPPPPQNYAPDLYEATAGVYWVPSAREDVWYFDSTVDDPDGPYDVVSVWADVYDDWNDQYIESFELYPTDDPQRWYSDWLGHTTHLDPWYGYYSVDFVVYDDYGATDYTTVWAGTY